MKRLPVLALALLGCHGGDRRPPRQSEPDGATAEQAVIVHFRYGHDDLGPVHAVEDRLTKAIQRAGVGEYDGNEVAGDRSVGTFYMYGPDADRLYSAVRPVLEATPFLQGARVKVRYGPPEPGVRERTIVIGSRK